MGFFAIQKEKINANINPCKVIDSLALWLPKVNGVEANECVCQQSCFLPQDDRSLFIKPPTVKDIGTLAFISLTPISPRAVNWQ